MKTRMFAGILLIVIILGGCVVAGETTSAIEVRPGVVMSNDPADLPIPTSGYSVYFVGESHGNHEAKAVLRGYLKRLYEEAGLRDMILEEDQAYEAEANAFVHGTNEELPDELCLRADVLKIIRDFNSGLPDNELVTVHLVDVDSPLTAIYRHLAELHQEMGTSSEAISFPEFSDFREWHGQAIYELIEKLRNASIDEPNLINALETVKLSLDWYYIGNRLEIGWPRGSRATFAPIREDVITKNIKFVLTQLGDRPVLAYFGLFHGMKAQGDPNPPVEGFKSWGERLADENIAVFSLVMFGASGESFWHKRTLLSDEEFLQGFLLPDGTSILSLFDAYPDQNIVYTDLHAAENSAIRLSTDLLDVPASQLFDGTIVFRKFTPMEDVCPK